MDDLTATADARLDLDINLEYDMAVTIDKKTLADTVEVLESNGRIFHAWANKIAAWSKDKDGRSEEIKQLRLMGKRCDAQAETIRKVLREIE